MADRDFAAELREHEQKIAEAQQQQGRLQSDKAALTRQKNEIVATCKELKVSPKRELIEEEIARTSAQLASELAAIDTDLKAIAA